MKQITLLALPVLLSLFVGCNNRLGGSTPVGVSNTTSFGLSKMLASTDPVEYLFYYNAGLKMKPSIIPLADSIIDSSIVNYPDHHTEVFVSGMIDANTIYNTSAGQIVTIGDKNYVCTKTITVIDNENNIKQVSYYDSTDALTGRTNYSLDYNSNMITISYADAGLNVYKKTLVMINNSADTIHTITFNTSGTGSVTSNDLFVLDKVNLIISDNATKWQLDKKGDIDYLMNSIEGQWYRYMEMAYNDHGDEIDQKVLDTTGSITFHWVGANYKYDAFGNWIERGIEQQASTTSGVERRRIKYHK
jgi:hypothetical protein